MSIESGENDKQIILDRIEAEFEVACQNKSQEELKRIVQNFGALTIAKKDAVKKLKIVIRILREKFGVGAR
jgi:hypothetical protein